MYDVFDTDDSERASRSAGWLPVVCWDELADASANLAPGDLLAVAGKLVPHHYIGNLILCRSLEVHASELRILTHRLFLVTREDGRSDNPPEGDPPHGK